MNKIAKILSLAAVLAASAPLALATPLSSISGGISITGSDNFTSTGITFGTNSKVLDTTGDFIGVVNDGAAVSLNNFSSSDTNFVLFTTPTGLATVTFTIASIDDFDVAGHGKFLNVDGTGTFTVSGFAPTAGTFTLTSSKNGEISFEIDTDSDTPITHSLGAVPEPSSLMLLGTGALSTAGAMFRKRRIA